MKVLKIQRKKEGGFILSAELILILTIGVIGLIVGLATLRASIVAELEDTAEAIGSLNQSYEFDGTAAGPAGTPFAATAGSVFADDIDTNAGDESEFSFVTATREVAGASVAGASSAANGGQTTTANL